RVWYGFKSAPRHPDILFPRLLAALIGKDGEDLALDLLLSYLNEGMHFGKVAEIRGTLRRTAEQKLVSLLAETDADHRSDLSGTLGVIFDIMGVIGGDEFDDLLKRGANINDPEVRLWAVASLLRLKKRIPRDSLYELAAEPRSRRRIWTELHKLG